MKIGRNETCPCGSGKKYKRCCEMGEVLQSKEGPHTSAAQASFKLTGLSGEAQGIVACNHFREESDPRNTGGPLGLPGDYQVTFLFERPGFKQSKEYEYSFTGPITGNSHLAITRPAFSPPGNPDADQIKVYAATPKGRFEFTGYPNAEGFLGKITSTPFHAKDRNDAQQNAYSALLPAISGWSSRLDIPLNIAIIETTEVRTGNTGIRVVTPFLEAPFAIQAVEPEYDAEFAHYSSMYREALNSDSPIYRFLCLFKIIEAIRLRRARLGKEAALFGREIQRPVERVPNAEEEFVPWLNAIFPIRREWDQMSISEIFPEEARGKRVSKIVTGELTNLRNSIAHAILASGELALSVDDLVQLQRVNRWLPLTRCVARRMLKNEFPKQYLPYLNEDGTINPD